MTKVHNMVIPDDGDQMKLVSGFPCKFNEKV